MEITETSREELEGLERDLARKLLQQVSEWKTMRSPARVHVRRRTGRTALQTPSGRRPGVGLSARPGFIRF